MHLVCSIKSHTATPSEARNPMAEIRLRTINQEKYRSTNNPWLEDTYNKLFLGAHLKKKKQKKV